MSKTWMYTLNNYTEEEIDQLKDMECSKHVCGAEVAPTTGTPHLQGRITFRKSWTLNMWKKFNTRLSVRKAYYVDCNYERKEGNIIIDFDDREQGRRSDLETACDIIKKGGTMKEVAEEVPGTYVRYHKGFMALKAQLIVPRNTVPTVTVFYGKTGKGKTRMAKAIAGENAYTWFPQMGKWFDGYTGQENVIMDEFRGQLALGQLLNMLDRYDCKVEYKGGIIEFCATNIVITSPKHPKDWYIYCGEDDVWAQLNRRITDIVAV